MQIPCARALFVFLVSVSISAAQAPVYVSNWLSNNISVIDPASNQVTATIPGLIAPKGMAASPDGSRLYVANQDQSSLAVINTVSRSVVDTIFLPDVPFGFVLSLDGRRAYVAFPFGNFLGVYDLGRKTELARIPMAGQPSAVAISPDGLHVYVTSADGPCVYVIETLFNRLAHQISIGFSSLGIAISPNGSRLYVVSQYPDPTPTSGPGAIWTIDTRRNEVIGSLSGSFGDAIAMSADGKHLYALIESTDLVVIDTAQNAIIFTLPTNRIGQAIAVSLDGSRLYIPAFSDNFTTVIDTASNSIVASIPVGQFPLAAIAPRPVGGLPVQPFVTCVRHEGSNYRAFFGYLNENNIAVGIPAGPQNQFTPSPQNRGQTTTFERGLIPLAFPVVFDGNTITWSVTGKDGIVRTSIASRSSFPCLF
jgi:YVTN family beta-propeller protein